MADASITQPRPSRRKKPAREFAGAARNQEANRKRIVNDLHDYALDCERRAVKARRLAAKVTSVGALRNDSLLCAIVHFAPRWRCVRAIAALLGVCDLVPYASDPKRFLITTILRGRNEALGEMRIDPKEARVLPHIMPPDIRAKFERQAPTIRVQGYVGTASDVATAVIDHITGAQVAKKPALQDALTQAVAIANSAAGIPDWTREPLTDRERKVRRALLDGAERDALSVWGRVMPGTVFRRIGITSRLQIVDDTPISRDDCDHLASDARGRWRHVYDVIRGERSDERLQDMRKALDDAISAVDRGEYDNAA